MHAALSEVGRTFARSEPSHASASLSSLSLHHPATPMAAAAAPAAPVAASTVESAASTATRGATKAGAFLWKVSNIFCGFLGNQ